MLAIRERGRDVVRLVVYAVVAVLAVATASYMGYMQWASTQGQTLAETTVKAAPRASSVESKMAVFGDVYWGRYINDWSMKSSLNYAYPFSRLSEFHRYHYDAWINDMECPITNNPKVSSAAEDTTLQFDCNPAYLSEAKKWFTAMTLANNHTDNQGADGFAETRQHLASADIQYFGHYDPEQYDDLCDVIAIPARAQMNDGTTKQVKLPMVWCGYHGVFRTPSADSLAVIKRYSDYFPVIAMPHSGAEYKPEPDEIKTTWHRGLIDSGADVVIGDHPHWVQSSEAYKGHLIIYSLGNFIFDQQYNAEVTRSAVLNMTVAVDAKDNPDLAAWIKLGEACGVYHDRCPAFAAERKLTKLRLTYHFSVQGSDNSGKIVKPATTQQLESIKTRLHWQQTVQGLRAPYSGE
jgi:poly-gamma-glutamate synthesis protein (capsule biosynthesis protein)